MSKQTSVVEWYVVDNEADWASLCAAPVPDIPPAVVPAACDRLALPYWLGVVAAVLLLAAAGSWRWRTTQAEVHPEHQEVAKAPDPLAASLITFIRQEEPSAATSSPRQSDRAIPGQLADLQALAEYQALLAGQGLFARQASGLAAARPTAAPAPPLNVTVDALDVYEDQAVARVVMYTEHGEPAYRQTRFYRRTTTGWLRTDPDATRWGPERSLETPSFVFAFRQNDAPAVIAVAPQIEALYTTMRDNLGLERVAGAEKLLIRVSVTQIPGDSASWSGLPSPVTVPSPAVYLAPVELTDAELLRQSVALPLLNYVQLQAVAHYGIRISWLSLLGGLGLWQLWDTDLPLSAWREDVVKWFYHDFSRRNPGQPLVLPQHYSELCAAPKLWMPSPMQMNIPLVCAGLDWESWFVAGRLSRSAHTRLDQFVISIFPDKYVQSTPVGWDNHPGQAVAAATLVEYAMVTYGRERLPALMAGLGQYDTWDTLLPAVYGVSAAAFEAGWRTYLAGHYAVPIVNR